MEPAGPDDTYEGYDDEDEEYYDNEEEGDPTTGLDSKHEEGAHFHHNGHYSATNNPEEEKADPTVAADVSEFSAMP